MYMFVFNQKKNVDALLRDFCFSLSRLLLHKVKQIVGSTLSATGETTAELETNFETTKSSADFARYGIFGVV